MAFASPRRVTRWVREALETPSRPRSAKPSRELRAYPIGEVRHLRVDELQVSGIDVVERLPAVFAGAEPERPILAVAVEPVRVVLELALEERAQTALLLEHLVDVIGHDPPLDEGE